MQRPAGMGEGQDRGDIITRTRARARPAAGSATSSGRRAPARSPCPGAGTRSRSSARRFAASARATSISSARSAICARMVTRSGSTSAKPNADREVVDLGALPVPQLAGPEQRQQRRVSGKHAEVAFDPGNLDLIDRSFTSDRSAETICSCSWVGESEAISQGCSFRLWASGRAARSRGMSHAEALQSL